MENYESYRIPTVEIENKNDVIDFLTENLPDCIFENIEEVTNPVGFQWNYTLTTKISSKNTGVLIAIYKECFFVSPAKKGIISTWLKEAIPAINKWYRGKLIP